MTATNYPASSHHLNNVSSPFRNFRQLFRLAMKFAALIGWLLVLPVAWAQTPNDVLIVGQVAEPKSLDPQAVTAVNDFRIVINLYDGLVRYKNGSLEVEPALATSWKISDDGTQQ